MDKFDAKLSVKMNPEALAEFKQILFDSTEEVFSIDIQAAAVEGSPVSKGRFKGGQYYGGGTNRRSINTEVAPGPRGVEASIYTQSGYGGYLEVGTYKMRARPYLFPAFERFVGKIAESTRGEIEMRRPVLRSDETFFGS